MLLALRRLKHSTWLTTLRGETGSGIDPSHCVVFEDALVGIEAAHRGGMKVVAVATTNLIETLQAADLAVHRLDELSVDQIAALIAG